MLWEDGEVDLLHTIRYPLWILADHVPNEAANEGGGAWERDREREREGDGGRRPGRKFILFVCSDFMYVAIET